MSFEGHYQILCERGHLSGVDVYFFSEWSDDITNWRCRCGGRMAWHNLVDDTNCCQADNEIELQLIKPAVECVCQCGNVHESKEAVYKIPKEN